MARKGKPIRLSNNFKSTEMECRCQSEECSEFLISLYLIEVLQKLRVHIGRPVWITSGYRCPSHNKSVGGVPLSKHVEGVAADIQVKGVRPGEVARILRQLISHRGCVIVYDTFVHFDVRKELLSIDKRSKK